MNYAVQASNIEQVLQVQVKALQLYPVHLLNRLFLRPNHRQARQLRRPKFLALRGLSYQT